MVESAGMAAQVQAKSRFRGFKIPSGSRLRSARNYWACYALNRTAPSANVEDKSPSEMRFGTAPRSPIPFLKPGYVKTKRQDKLRLKVFPCFFLEPSANRPRNTYEVLLNSGNVVHSRNATWARLPPSVAVSAENVRYVSISRKGGNLDRHGVVEVDEDVDLMSQASPSAFDRESLHAWLPRLLRLSHAGGLHRRAVEVPPRLLR